MRHDEGLRMGCSSIILLYLCMFLLTVSYCHRPRSQSACSTMLVLCLCRFSFTVSYICRIQESSGVSFHDRALPLYILAHCVALSQIQEPSEKVQARWVVDCSLPIRDRVIDVEELLQYFRENIKVRDRCMCEHARRRCFVNKTCLRLDFRCIVAKHEAC